MPSPTENSKLISLATIISGSLIIHQLDKVKALSIGRTMQEAGLTELTMTTDPIELQLSPDGFSMTGGHTKSGTGPVKVNKKGEIRGICLMARAVDKDKIKFSFTPLINQKEVKPAVNWVKVKDGPDKDSDLEVILYEAFAGVEITANETVAA